MIKRALLTLPLYLFLGCDYQDIVGSSESDSNSSSILIAKSETSKASIPMLAVLINYNNIEISSSEDIWSKKLFGNEESELNSYYKEVSSNNFEYIPVDEDSGIVNDGVVSVYLNKNHPNMDVDSPNFEINVYPDFKTSLDLVDEFVDFSKYDIDENGLITPDELIITFIMAGYEDAYEGRHVTNGIWGHQSCVNFDLNLDKVSLLNCQDGGNFAIFGERHNIYDPHDATIGIIAHELGHATFNLPDLYNTSNPDEGGIGYFGIMGSGTWARKDNNEYAGATPSHFTAWCKIYNNWIEPIVVNNTQAVLNETSSLNYNILKIPIDDTKYYLLENRNNSGYDRSLASLSGIFNGGIAIWKVDETKLTKSYIDANNVNADTENKGVDLVEAVDGDIDKFGDGGDENALYYDTNKNYFSTLVTNISQRGSSMSLDIK